VADAELIGRGDSQDVGTLTLGERVRRLEVSSGSLIAMDNLTGLPAW
jgi:hypothetical protein